MSARPGDWSLLGYASDPLPGDVTEVESQARSYREVASEIDAQIARLRQIASGDDGQQGKYVAPLRSSASELSGELTKIQTRFDTVASQLTTWATTLDEGRSRSQTLLNNAEDAHADMARNAPGDPLPHHASQEEIDADHARASRYGDATAALQSYVDAMADLMDGTKNPPGVNGVARRVAQAISDASNDSVKDSWWDSHVRKWIHDHAHLIEVIVKIIAVVAIVVAVAALILATGGFGLLALAGVAAETLATMATVASVLETVGAVLSVALLGGHLTEMYGGVGNVGLGTIALDVAALATFGLGRVAARAVGSMIDTATNAARDDAMSAAIGSLSPRVMSALKITSDANPLKVWALAQRDAALAAASEPLDAALDAFKTLGRTQLAVKILTSGGTELAEQATKLQALESFPVARGLVSGVMAVTRVRSAVAIGEAGKTIWEGTKLPGEIHETVSLLTGGGADGD